MYSCFIFCEFSTVALYGLFSYQLTQPGETPTVPLLLWDQGERVDDGLSHPVHQGRRGSIWEGRIASRAQEWSGRSCPN